MSNNQAENKPSLANRYIKLAILLGLASIIPSLEIKNDRVQEPASELAPVVVINEVPTITTSIKVSQKSKIHHEEHLEVIYMQISPISIFLIGGAIVVIAIASVLRPKEVLGLAIIHEDKVGIVIKTLGRPIPTNQLISLQGEAGSQVETLSPGWHWFKWSWMYNIRQEKAIHISPDEIGFVEAKDGAIQTKGQVFGQIVECDNFQDGRAFLKNNGQRGKQRAILTNGTYRINTELFTISKQQLTFIDSDEIGLVKAQDGVSLEPGKIFGQVVDCDNFQDAQKFFENKGQRGKQIVTLGQGTYQINSQLFEVHKGKLTGIKPGEIGIVEAREGKPMPKGQSFGQVIDCNDFQDGAKFLQEGGHKGKQLNFLAAGTYQINTNLFKIKTIPEVGIKPGEIGIVEATDGAFLEPGKSFGRVVECDNFQDAQAFLENGGQKGRQLTFLGAGNYQINTDLFEIKKIPATKIEQNKIGLVEALGGQGIEKGKTFGRVVECDNFQDAQAFLKSGGQKGKQLAHLMSRTYYINTNLFKIKQVPITTISNNEIGLVEAQDGAPLEPGKIFGQIVNCNNFQDAQAFLTNGGQKGKQLSFLGIGNYQINNDFFIIRKIPVIKISQEHIGLVEAVDGDFLAPERIFGKVVKCNKFQDAQAFLDNLGQRGKQLAILQPGTYQINTDFFKIKEVPVTTIPFNFIGLVEAKDGQTLPAGKNFGQVVDCDNFQDAQAFLKNDGQTGKQLNVLQPGTYYINSDLFEVNKIPVTKISVNEIGLVEAKEGEDLPPGETFGKFVECNNFQNIQKFLANGGQRGKQLAVLQPGTYQINTDLFEIEKTPVTKISSNEIGLVEAKDGQPLEQDKMFGQVVDCNNFQNPHKFLENVGQRGKQLSILQEGTYYINTELFSIKKEKIVNIAPNEIGLVIANDGKPLKRGQTLGKIVDCNKFQDAQAFLDNGGQQGQQLSFLPTGTYRINTELFTVITPANAIEHRMNPDDFRVITIDDDKIGIVTTHDGQAREENEIAGSVIPEHENFRKAEKFIEGGGQQGLQEEILPSGRWILNPWFVTVKQVPLTVIPNGHVGVIKSNIGKTPVGNDKLVDRGYRGIWRDPFQSGKYQINTDVQDVVIIPINDLVLKWSNKKEEDLEEDSPKVHKHLPALKVQSKNGFTFEVEVSQIIRVSEKDAPEMLCNVASTVKSVDELIEEVLRPTVQSYFLGAAQRYEALYFQEKRDELQAAARQHIKEELKAYNVEAKHTLILEIDLPDELTKLARETKIAEQQIGQYEMEAQLAEAEAEKTRKEKMAESAVEEANEQTNAIISAIKREEKSKQLEEERKQKREDLILEDEANRKQTEWILHQAKVEAEVKKLMEEIAIKSDKERKENEAQFKKSLSELNTQEINFLNALGSDKFLQLKIAETSQGTETARAVAMIQAAMTSQSIDKEKTIEIAKAIGGIKLPDNPKFVAGDKAAQAIGSMGNPLGLLIGKLSNVLGGSNSNPLAQFGLSSLGLNESNPSPQLGNFEPAQFKDAPSENSSKGETPSASVATTVVEPRFPVILLLDTSSGMSGECINKLNSGLAAFKHQVRQDANSSLRLDLSAITFNDSVQTVQDFVTIDQFSPPQLAADGLTAMGQGIELALRNVKNRVENYENKNIQHHKPWVFLIIGSQPTDSWHNAAKLAQQAVEAEKLNLFVVGVENVDIITLRKIAPSGISPVILDGLKFQEMFRWLSESIAKVTCSEVGSNFDFSSFTG